MSSELMAAVNSILDLYDRVATGETQGARGSFYADGKGTLNSVHVDIESIEALARAAGRTIHPRGFDYRNSKRPQS